MSDDDFSLFTSEMRGVKRIQVDQADTGKVRPDRQQIQQRLIHFINLIAQCGQFSNHN